MPKITAALILCIIICVVAWRAGQSQQEQPSISAASRAAYPGKGAQFTIGDLLNAFQLRWEDNLRRIVVSNHKWRIVNPDTLVWSSFTMENHGTAAIEDVQISCSFFDKSGALLDTVTKTVYAPLKSNSQMLVSEMLFGRVRGQPASGSCQATSFEYALDLYRSQK